jgi:hypothetical protein
VVLDQLRVPIGRPDSRSIIDGQQRLTTLQLLMVAFRDLCSGKAELELHRRRLERMILNEYVTEESDKYKVWPTNIDRDAYVMTVTAGSAEMVRDWMRRDEVRGRSRIAGAYLYFAEKLAEWLQLSDATCLTRCEALLNAIREKIRLVVIEMDDQDDAQMIFETLNARGTPLLPSDLVKNYLFRRAQEERADVEQLYKDCWFPFDRDDHFWREEVRQGRLKRPRIDLFLQHYLTLQKNDEVTVATLFSEFRAFADTTPEADAAWHLGTFRKYAERFREFRADPWGNREEVFFHRLDVMDTSTLFPFLLGLYEATQDDEGQAGRPGVLTDLESYMVRRMLCRLTTKNYNRLFLDMLARLRARGQFSRAAVREFLAGQTGSSVRWPDDEEFQKAWVTLPLYKALTRPRTAMILQALDQGLQGSKTEAYSLKEDLTIEHIMPQYWEEHWPLPDAGVTDGSTHPTPAESRNLAIHTIGNLTLLTEALNPSVSNGPFARKRHEILRHSAINLNRHFLMDASSWDEEAIFERGLALFESARRIWPHPGHT